jgi:hypothetical protein
MQIFDTRQRGITSLYLRGSTKYCLKQDIMPMVYSLMNNKCMEVLDITGNNCGDTLGIGLGKVLQINSTLRELYPHIRLLAVT